MQVPECSNKPADAKNFSVGFGLHAVSTVSTMDIALQGIFNERSDGLVFGAGCMLC